MKSDPSKKEYYDGTESKYQKTKFFRSNNITFNLSGDDDSKKRNEILQVLIQNVPMIQHENLSEIYIPK